MKKLEKIFEPKIALPLITLIAAVFRLIPVRYKYLFGYDPYFDLAYIEESLKAGYWIKFITFGYAPYGREIYHPLGLYLTPYYIYRFFLVFGVSLYDAFRITPVIFGVLTIIFFYLAMFNFYGKKEAFFSALFLSIMFGHVFRSMEGHYKGDNYMLFWYSVALFGISLAFKYWRKRWRYIFYLIPAISSGLASIFWQAYYPIFGFLIGNAVFIAIGAFILNKRKYFLDSAMIVFSTAFGAFFANYLIQYFGYGMLGENRGLSKEIVEAFGLNLGMIRDVYLLLHLKYLVPLASIGILVLWLLAKYLNKNLKIRTIVGGIILVFGVFFIFTKLGILRELSSGFGILREIPTNLQDRRSTFQDLFAAYNVILFLTPLYFLSFRRKKVKVVDIMNLSIISLSSYMIYIWTRFLFIGSMAIALMAGIGVARVLEIVDKLEKRKMIIGYIIFLVLLSTSFTLSFERVYREKPFMNKYWENALIYLKEHSYENDVVLTWWDYGHWVSYYARRAPVAQGSVNSFVAKYYLGKIGDNKLMAKGVDYIIVSYDTALKFGAILDTARAEKEGHFLMILPLTSRIGALVFERGEYKILAKPGNKWNILICSGNAVFSPKEAFLEYRGNITKLELKGGKVVDAYVYLNLNYGYAVLMTEKSFNTTLAKLMFTNKYPENYKLVYSDGGYIKIFKFTHPNVEIKKEKSTIHFEVANGDKEYTLCISGFYENGTKVFNDCYAIAKDKSIGIKTKIPGVKVIRYTLCEREMVLDGGVFRVYS